MLHAAARICAVILLLVSCSIANHLALAGEVPATAHSTSLGMPPLLVDHAALTALFPQRLVDQPRQAFGWQLGASSPETIGGIVPLGPGLVALALSQQHQSLTSETRRQLQLALGCEVGPVRLGAALRGFDDNAQQTQSTFDGASSSHWSDDSEFTFLEGAIGFQARIQRATLDLAAEFRDEDTHVTSVYENQLGSISRSETRASTRSAFRFAARGEAPLTTETRLIAGAVIQTGDRTWSAAQLQPTGLQLERRTTDDDIVWEGGVAIARELQSESEVTAFVHRSAVRTTDLRTLDRVDTAERIVTLLGAAWRGGILPRTQLLLGIGIARESSLTQAIEGDSTLLREARREDRVIVNRFSWGVTHEWRALRLAGAMRSTLDLDDLFLTVDAGLVF